MQQPAAPGETDSIQPEIEEDDCNAPVEDDLEKGLGGLPSIASNNASGAACSDNTMNEEGINTGGAVSGTGPTGNGDADMEFVSGSSLPPINDRKNKNLDKAAQKTAREIDECTQFKSIPCE